MWVQFERNGTNKVAVRPKRKSVPGSNELIIDGSRCVYPVRTVVDGGFCCKVDIRAG
jgi:hypothetical protein